ncbi:MAG: hypothetical protein BTN85_1503 [Candidatus Methanohalarchaeum thermophilum]|uniref:Uncharacterized protein n=1 Tax=Methanohalarchaeum thermophilum TaxID=1903181 RepID=A0A1Q6DXB3_METT1|nr:MAG: hypothetical protein BTN85_1503 [Candidatus Methanohalarchaeum thermophilum]
MCFLIETASLSYQSAEDLFQNQRFLEDGLQGLRRFTSCHRQIISVQGQGYPRSFIRGDSLAQASELGNQNSQSVHGL